jgi:hypothetical protein
LSNSSWCGFGITSVGANGKPRPSVQVRTSASEARDTRLSDRLPGACGLAKRRQRDAQSGRRQDPLGFDRGAGPDLASWRSPGSRGDSRSLGSAPLRARGSRVCGMRVRAPDSRLRRDHHLPIRRLPARNREPIHHDGVDVVDRHQPSQRPALAARSVHVREQHRSIGEPFVGAFQLSLEDEAAQGDPPLFFISSGITSPSRVDSLGASSRRGCRVDTVTPLGHGCA